jgi:hypothetical protein
MGVNKNIPDLPNLVTDPTSDALYEIYDPITDRNYNITHAQLLALFSSGGGVAFPFTTVADVALNILHSLGTKDFVFTIFEGNDAIEADVAHVDNDNLTITTNVAVTGRIVLISVS